MAIFSKKENPSTDKNTLKFFSVKHPRMTEKAAMKTTENVYVFDVFKNSNKKEIEKSIILMFGVFPKKINIVNTRAKAKFVKGKKGKTSSSRKAYVFLKEGDKINLA